MPRAFSGRRYRRSAGGLEELRRPRSTMAILHKDPFQAGMLPTDLRQQTAGRITQPGPIELPQTALADLVTLSFRRERPI